MELRPHDGIYVNGKRVILKGVNRHSEWPESGRTLSKALNIMDVNLMKDMNMNAVEDVALSTRPAFFRCLRFAGHVCFRRAYRLAK